MSVWPDGTRSDPDELALEVESLRIDDLDIAGRVQRAGHAGDNYDRHHDASMTAITMNQRFSVRLTISGTRPSGWHRI